MVPSSGTVTFLFSDIEGSTRMWESQPQEMYIALQRHDALMREAIVDAGGHVFKTVGDGFYAAFGSARSALDATINAQHKILATTWETADPIKVRMALHTGLAEMRDNDYFGQTLNRLARLLSTGHGGQVLLSASTHELIRDSVPDDVTLIDMGWHRLKDLDSPERVFMVQQPGLRSEFPKLKSLDALPNNLPRQLTSFVGREAERLQVLDMLRESSLLTLTGSGGTGKSRLALQVAADDLDNFKDGVWLVELSPLTDPNLVAQTVANVLSVRESPGVSVARALVDFLREKKVLLVLDNCEHLLQGAAQLVDDMLRASPDLKVIATSREPLGVSGESLYRVPSLGVGEPGRIRTATQALAFDSVRLLVERAQLSQPQFKLTDKNAHAAAQICHRLDGIPFAIELAASRIKVLTLEQIAARLDDRFRLLTGGSRTALPRQQTLRAMIDWSYDLLEDNDKTLLRRVSVFAGGFILEAAEVICADEVLESWEVLDGLARLVDKSLVNLDQSYAEPRYRLLETVRQYGQEKLVGEEAEAVRGRHAEYYAQFVVDNEELLLGPEQQEWLARYELEHDNIRGALGFFRGHPELCERALETIGAIGRFWTVRGYLTEGREWIETILAVAPGGATEAKANAWRAAGQMAYWQGDAQAGRKFGEESLRLCRELGDRRGETISLFRLGFATLSEGDLGASRSYFEQALRLGREIDDKPGIPHLLNAMGELSWTEGKSEEAHGYFDEALGLFRKFGDQRSIASVLKNLGNVACASGQYEVAHDYLAEAVEIMQTLENTTGLAVTLEAFGVLAGAQARHVRAIYLIAAAHAMHETHGSRSEPSDAPRVQRTKEAADTALGRLAFDGCWEAGGNLAVEQAITIAKENTDPDPSLEHAEGQESLV